MDEIFSLRQQQEWASDVYRSVLYRTVTGSGLIEEVQTTSVLCEFLPSGESTEPEKKETFVLLCAVHTNK
jgi:hypothetical protein